ncbi:hypothetical protein [Pseudomonas sp. 2995-3]|uniref:hypothetical protein n=1 Tax=Pseudomonas sp. 2995-3 TaxID=1712680 RepID=UPI000C148EFC|nr:hypothetical protein [Pseudomonas sp. 2995-3]PIB69523.1 hypothetical protein AOA62_03910 [Pseudomonas sp. 2995-3]
MKMFVGALALVALAGCLEQGKTSDGLSKATKLVESTPIAANSPDAAVKSWWAVKDASIMLDRQICTEYSRMKAPVKEKLGALASDSFPKVSDCFDGMISFDRKIAKVEIESDTRAVVNAVIKNSAPPEPGAVLDDGDRSAKEAGERYRYTLERKGPTDSWKISSIENYPSYARDWESAYKAPKPSNNRYVYEQFQ